MYHQINDGRGPLEHLCVHTCIRLRTLCMYVSITEGPYDDGNAALSRATEAIQPGQIKLDQLIERLRWLVVVSS